MWLDWPEVEWTDSLQHDTMTMVLTMDGQHVSLNLLVQKEKKKQNFGVAN